MNKRTAPKGAWLALLALTLVLLAGCASQLRSETFVLPDSEEDRAVDQGGEPFEVKTIYRLPIPNGEDRSVLGWLGTDAVAGLFGNQGREQSLERIVFPYETPERVWTAESDLSVAGLSPDGRYATGFAKEQNNKYSLALIAVSDRQRKVIETVEPVMLRSKSMAWSNNSRYVAYLSVTPDKKNVALGVYDIAAEAGKQYAWTEGRETLPVSSVKVSDDGLGALVVKGPAKASGLALGALADGAFAVQYEHSLSGDAQADWIGSDQIAFVGTDGTLFTYDRRNGVLTVVLERVDMFALSPDRKNIAYSKDGDSVYVGKLQGNNILNEKLVYQGVVPSRMSWSPDGGALLIEGRKPYAREISGPAPVAENLPFIVEFQ